jgi:hypothetical protein
MTLGRWLNATVDADIEPRRRIGCDVGKDGIRGMQPAILVVAVAVGRAGRLMSYDKVKLLRRRDRERTQQHRIDERKDGGVGANPKRQ